MDFHLHAKIVSRAQSNQLLHPLFLAPSSSSCNHYFPRHRDARFDSKRPLRIHQRRKLHTRRKISSTTYDVAETESPSSDMPPSRPLSCLALSTLVRSYVITSISSIPFLLRPSLSAMSFLAHTKSPLFNADRNPLLHFLLRKTFYAQFCAGETPSEVRTTISELKDTGFKGVI